MNTEKISTPVVYKSKRKTKFRRPIDYVFLLTVVFLAASTALIRAVSLPATTDKTIVYNQYAVNPELSVARRFNAARIAEREMAALSDNPELSLAGRFDAAKITVNESAFLTDNPELSLARRFTVGGITGEEVAILSINPELSVARRFAASRSEHSDGYKEWLLYSNNPELMLARR